MLEVGEADNGRHFATTELVTGCRSQGSLDVAQPMPDTRPKKPISTASQQAEAGPAFGWLCFVKRSLLVRLLGILLPTLPSRR